VVLHISIGEISFLLMAELMWQTELELITERAIPESTVLKVAHHGSATSTTTEFLNVVNPQLAVISVGEGNEFGHPSEEVIARLEDKLGAENIYRTDKDGTIEFITDGDRLWLNIEN
jgi:competence protein ComEC